jgi:endogenous inhibitor of DNA gyrase (YacG/DUF329 family)
MYCPNCGQQQVSDEMRFCSRCGLALSGLTEWLAAGRSPTRPADDDQVAMDSPRRKGLRRGAKLMFFSLVIFAISLVVSIGIDEGAVMLFPCALFFISLVWILYARLFIPKTKSVSPPVFQAPSVQSHTFGSNSARGSLTPATTMSIPPISQVKTNELAQPPSVTENTTRLLDE